MADFTKPHSKSRSFIELCCMTGVFILLFVLTLTSSGANICDFFQLSPAPHFHLWGLVTYMFIHTDFAHLVSNLIMLWIGFYLIHHSRRLLFVPTFLIGGLAGGIIFLIADKDGISMIGASNGIAAIIGSALFFTNGRNSNRYSYRLMAIVLLLFALTGNLKQEPVILSHLTGAASGVVFACCFNLFVKRHRRAIRKENAAVRNPDIEEKLRNSGYNSLSEEERQKLF